MKKTAIYLISLLVVIIVAVAVIVMVLLKGEKAGEQAATSREPVYAEAGSSIPTLGVILFFHDPDEEFLITEKRNIYSTPLLSDRAKQLIIELMRGPALGGVATVPPGTSLRELYILEDGTACVDFSREFEEKADRGSSSQLYQIYSVVNSLAYNFPEIEGVRILIEGEQKISFGGHIYTGGVFREKLSIVKFPESHLPSEENRKPEEVREGEETPETLQEEEQVPETDQEKERTRSIPI